MKFRYFAAAIIAAWIVFVLIALVLFTVLRPLWFAVT